MLKNKIQNNEVVENIFNPDFFQEYDFPHLLSQQIAISKVEFFGSNIIYGPTTNQMAIVEVNLARKKIYRGTLSRFLGVDTLFPLVNTVENRKEINHKDGYITIVCVERVSGQVVNSFSICEEFTPELFNIELNELHIGGYKNELITEFKYSNSLFKSLRSDSVIRNQWAYIF